MIRPGLRSLAAALLFLPALAPVPVSNPLAPTSSVVAMDDVVVAPAVQVGAVAAAQDQPVLAAVALPAVVVPAPTLQEDPTAAQGEVVALAAEPVVLPMQLAVVTNEPIVATTELVSLAIEPAASAFVAPAAAQPLLALVPGDAAAVWSWRSGSGTTELESRLETSLDAFVDARFDSWIFDTAEIAGLPPEVLREVEAIRNVLVTVGAIVPWRELVRGDFVLARCGEAPLGDSGRGILLMSRPHADHVANLEAQLGSVLGALAGTIGAPVRYDITHNDTLEVPVYQLTLRGPHEKPLVQAAVKDGLVLLGSGRGCLDGAAALIANQDVTRLVDDPRFHRDLTQVPRDAAGLWYVDVAALDANPADLTAMLADRGLMDGPWEAMIVEALRLPEALDSLSGVVTCEYDAVVCESTTRFREDAPHVAIAGLSEPMDPELMGYVPGDSLSFTMRGQVDLVPVWKNGLANMQQEWPAMEEVFWFGEIVQATLDLWVARDVLPWLGASHVSMTMPSRAMSGQTDSVTLFQLADRDGAASCLRRIDGVLERVIPRLADKLAAWTEEAQLPWPVGIQHGKSDGMWRGLSKITIQAGPIPVPPISYGLVGNMLVLTSSERALTWCMAVAAGEEDGLEVHPLLADHVGRDDLTSLQLHPLATELQGTVAMLGMVEGMLRGMTNAAAQNDPHIGEVMVQVTDLFAKLDSVLSTFDYLGDAVTVGTRDEGGLVRRQQTTYSLLIEDPTGYDSPFADVAR
jgi:hypothetical protein